MGNYLGVPSSVQVSFPPPPFPVPVSRPPIVPPMRQLDIGLGPPSPFQPGRTPLPIMVPSLATRPPIVQPDGVQVVAATHPNLQNLNARGPIDQILISNQMNKAAEANPQSQPLYNQSNGQVIYQQPPMMNQFQQISNPQLIHNQQMINPHSQYQQQLQPQQPPMVQHQIHNQQLIQPQMQFQPQSQVMQPNIDPRFQQQPQFMEQQVIYQNQQIPQQMIQQHQLLQLQQIQQMQQMQEMQRLQQMQEVQRQQQLHEIQRLQSLQQLEAQQSQIPIHPYPGVDQTQPPLLEQQTLRQSQLFPRSSQIQQQTSLRQSQISPQPDIFGVQQPHQLLQEHIPLPNIGSVYHTPQIQQISSLPVNQTHPTLEQMRLIPNVSGIQTLESNPQPSLVYAKPAGSVPLIPDLILETIHALKQSRTSPDEGPPGVALEPFYIPGKQAYYEGQWINGLPGGYARIFYDSGAYFEGYFVNGQAFCKEGIWVYPDGSYYTGGIAHSAPNGLGQLMYKGRGMRYIGNWINGKPNGQGKQEFQDGSFFEGSFVNGVKQGLGKFTWSDGSFYEGEFRNGFMEGHGVKQFSNGSVFTGEFKKNKIFGKGIFNNQRGQYKGQFIDNKREGMGTFRYSDGRIYVGEFRSDLEEGRGKMFVPNGQVIEGEWRNGKNMAIHNISQSTSISEISLTDLGQMGNGAQFPNVPLTISLQGQNQIIPQPIIAMNSGIADSNALPSYHYSANYHPPPSLQSSLHP